MSQQEFKLTTGYNKASKPATYKQIEYLLSFDNVEINCSKSQIMKRLNTWDLSEAIDNAKAGVKVIIN